MRADAVAESNTTRKGSLPQETQELLIDLLIRAHQLKNDINRYRESKDRRVEVDEYYMFWGRGSNGNKVLTDHVALYNFLNEKYPEVVKEYDFTRERLRMQIKTFKRRYQGYMKAKKGTGGGPASVADRLMQKFISYFSEKEGTTNVQHSTDLPQCPVTQPQKKPISKKKSHMEKIHAVHEELVQNLREMMSQMRSENIAMLNAMRSRPYEQQPSPFYPHSEETPMRNSVYSNLHVLRPIGPTPLSILDISDRPDVDTPQKRKRDYEHFAIDTV